MRARSIALALLVLVALAACQSVPKDAFRLSEASLEQRQLQTRTFEGTDEETVLSAAAGVSQPLGAPNFQQRAALPETLFATKTIPLPSPLLLANYCASSIASTSFCRKRSFQYVIPRHP